MVDESRHKRRGVGTDLPINSVVHPSRNSGPDMLHDAIMSYSWAQDATRMAGLIASSGQESINVYDPVIQFCLLNLVKLLAKTENPPTLQDLESSYLARQGFAWLHEPNTAGGFALLVPDNPRTRILNYTKPLYNGTLWVCGEAMNAHHAWISGALDSVAVAVSGWLRTILRARIY